MRGAALRAARPGGNQPLRLQPGGQRAADVAPEDITQPVPGDRLVQRHGHQHGHILAAQRQRLISHIRGHAHSGGIGRAGAQHPPGPDSGHLKGAPRQIRGKIPDQQIERNIPHHPRQILARHRRGTGKKHRFDAAHKCLPAHLRRQPGKLPVKARLRLIPLPAHSP